MGHDGRRLELGFLTFVPDHGGPGGAGGALADGLALVEHAENLGYDSAWVRVRHHEPFLSSPMTFFAAASQRTTRIRLGTGVIPMRYEDPLRLAEDAATVDLLSGGRLELGISNGIPVTATALDALHGASDRGFAGEAQHRIDVLRAAVAGRSLGSAVADVMSIPAGGNLLSTPHSPGLQDRLWYGAGSETTAARAGTQGFDLQLSTLNTEETGEPFDVVQARQITSYRKAFADAGHSAHRSGRVSVGRIILPHLTPADAEEHREFVAGYRSGMTADGRPTGEAPPAMRFSAILDGDPSEILRSLQADAAVEETDGLVVVLPANGSAESHRRVLSAVTEHIAPHLGWTPRR